jgi:hypothetical protein
MERELGGGLQMGKVGTLLGCHDGMLSSRGRCSRFGVVVGGGMVSMQVAVDWRCLHVKGSA